MDPIAATLEAGGRVLLAGAQGTGKSTLAATLAERAAQAGIDVACIGCDPGSPAFGPPGAVCAADRDRGAWRLVDVEPLCTLDAVRFRLPLAQAVMRLLDRCERRAWLLDGPGAVRGVPGAELVTALATAARAAVVVLIERPGGTDGLAAELRALGLRVVTMPAAPEARAPGKRARARARTALWDAYLATDTCERELDLDSLPAIGTPPPRETPSAWQGRQVALLDERTCAAFGEIVSVRGRLARIRVRGDASAAATALLVRDACRAPGGLLGTAERFGREVRYRATAAGPLRSRSSTRSSTTGRLAMPDSAADDVPENAGDALACAHDGALAREHDGADPRDLQPVVRVGPFVATLVNGVLGDPLLLVRMQHRSRTLSFDLGETHRLGARVAHQVTDVFISHAHIDHIAGFLWLLRSRIGVTSCCRLYGPPGLAANVNGLVNGVHWDRAGEGAPRFDVTELGADDVARRFAVRAGDPVPRALGASRAAGGLLLDEPLVRVRAVTLDHLTPVLAFALESVVEINVRKERLAALGLAPGPWLARLKEHVAAGRADEVIGLPDGSERRVGELADMLVLLRSGTKLVYATDLADTADNRRRLEALARDADVMFCESTFRESDADRAARTGHLTTTACGEIASAANVARLVPFHFSRRYESSVDDVYREVRAACANTVVPRPGNR
ncbi:MAG TPA: Clp1/GlmU family protein [Gammaproteobacteria bacterium]